jgi:hypothetical protein
VRQPPLPLAVDELARGVAGLPKRLHPPAEVSAPERGACVPLLAACGELPNRLQPPELAEAGDLGATAARAVDWLVTLDRGTFGAATAARLEFPIATLPCCRLICARLCCCCANGTRFAGDAAGALKRLLLNAPARTGDVTGRSENRKLEDEGAIGTWPFTRLACWSCVRLTCMGVIRPREKSFALTAVTPFVTRAFR